MSSQKSMAATALEPKRRRGQLRVAAIVDAGVSTFIEKGYDAATMTEIAARSNTAIGSLYRFFPTKEALAEAILARYRDHMEQALDEIAARAPQLSAVSLADALVDFMLDARAERAAAVALVDARSDAADKRMMLRRAVRERLAAILVAAAKTLPRREAERMAAVLLPLLKIASQFARENGEEAAPLVAEVRELVRFYLARALGKTAGPVG